MLARGQTAVVHHSPLEDVIDLLCRGRHYAWVGIFLAVERTGAQQSMGAAGDPPAEVALPETRSKILISMKLASRELGVLSVESDRENALARKTEYCWKRWPTRWLASWLGMESISSAGLDWQKLRMPGTSN